MVMSTYIKETAVLAKEKFFFFLFLIVFLMESKEKLL